MVRTARPIVIHTLRVTAGVCSAATALLRASLFPFTSVLNALLACFLRNRFVNSSIRSPFLIQAHALRTALADAINVRSSKVSCLVTYRLFCPLLCFSAEYAGEVNTAVHTIS